MSAQQPSMHGHDDPRDGFPLKSECCGRSCCQGETWHVFPFCTIREALIRRREKGSSGVAS